MRLLWFVLFNVLSMSMCLEYVYCSLQIQPPLIRSRCYVQNVVAGANERRLYLQAKYTGTSTWVPASKNNPGNKGQMVSVIYA